MSTYRIGFTGTRHGMTEAQLEALANELLAVELYAADKGATQFELHHDCKGADAQVHEMARKGGYRVVVHPGDIATMRAWCEGDEVLLPEQTLLRNAAIVDAAHVLFAAPEGPETQRSGTWSTIRRARRVGKPICIVWSDGKATKERKKSVCQFEW